MNKRRIFCILLTIITTLTLLTGCGGKASPHTREGFYFDTYIRITVHDADDAEGALEKAFSHCAYWDGLWGRDTSGSDVWRINHAAGTSVEVEEETARLIEKGLYYSQLSGGVFDITCGAVTSLWDFSSDNPAVPDEKALAAAVKTIDYTSVRLEGNTVTVPEGTMLDLGGIAKGYIADLLADELRGAGVRSAVIDLGGNIFAMGSKAGGDFSIAVQSPYPDEDYLDVLSVSDRSVVTAGSYERCFERDGVLYHHILDTQTGMPAETGIQSVTVVSQSSCEGDALATICFLLGADDALALIESTPGAEMIMALDDGSAVFSSGYGAYSQMNSQPV